MASIFTKIINGEIPGQLVWKDEVCAVFLDIQPLVPGHALVVPLEEVDHWVDLPAETTAHLMHVANRVGRAQRTAFQAERVGVVIQGFEVPHTHIHVFPANSMADFNPANRQARDSEDVAADAEKIRTALREQGDDQHVTR